MVEDFFDVCSALDIGNKHSANEISAKRRNIRWNNVAGRDNTTIELQEGSTIEW